MGRDSGIEEAVSDGVLTESTGAGGFLPVSLINPVMTVKNDDLLAEEETLSKTGPFKGGMETNVLHRGKGGSKD